MFDEVGHATDHGVPTSEPTSQPRAAQLMMVLAQLAPADIPRDLVAAGATVLPVPLADAAIDGVYADQVIRVLRELALITADRPGLLRVHQLVAEVLREHPMPVPDKDSLWQRLLRAVGVGPPPRSWIRVGADLLAEALPADVKNPVHWGQWALLLPHAEAVIERSDPPSTTTGTLQYLCGAYLYRRGEYPSARRYLTHSVEVRSQLLGEEHPNTLTSLHSLALDLHALGEVVAARELNEKTLAVRRRVLGEEHPDTLQSMNNLALALYALGEVVAARVLNEKTLAVRRRVLGEEHPDTLQSMYNLAIDLHALGEVVGARELNEKILAVRRRVLGEEHPDTLKSMNNLASDLHALGEVAAARVLNEKTLAVRRRVLGEEHPNTLQSMNNLAAIERAVGGSGSQEGS